jgi:hypothetical protein
VYLKVTFRADIYPGVLGKKLSIRISNTGSADSLLAVDQLMLTHSVR